MSQTTVMMKIIAFIMLVSFILIVIAQDEAFKEFDVHRTGFEDFQRQLGENPLTEIQTLKPAEDIELEEEATVTKKPCWFENYCWDLPTDFIWESIVDTGKAIVGFAIMVGSIFGRVFDTITWFFSTVWILIRLLALIVTFTIPGIPFLVQMMMWTINVSMWVGMFYIGFRAIRGGG